MLPVELFIYYYAHNTVDISKYYIFLFIRMHLMVIYCYLTISLLRCHTCRTTSQNTTSGRKRHSFDPVNVANKRMGANWEKGSGCYCIRLCVTESYTNRWLLILCIKIHRSRFLTNCPGNATQRVCQI